MPLRLLRSHRRHRLRGDLLAATQRDRVAILLSQRHEAGVIPPTQQPPDAGPVLEDLERLEALRRVGGLIRLRFRPRRVELGGGGIRRAALILNLPLRAWSCVIASIVVPLTGSSVPNRPFQTDQGIAVSNRVGMRESSGGVEKSN